MYQLKDKIYLLTAAFCYALLVISNKWLTDQGITVFNQIFQRVFWGILFSGAAILLYEKNDFKLSKAEFKNFVFNGFLFLGGFCTFSLGIYLGTPLAKAVSLNYANPLFIILFSYIWFRELPNLKQLLAICLSLFSVSLIMEVWKINNWHEFKLGELMALSNALFYGAIIVFGRKVRQVSPNGLFKSLFYSQLFMIVGLVLFSYFLYSKGFSDFKPDFQTNYSLMQFLVLLASAFFGGVLPIVLIYKALPRTKSFVSSLLMLTEPVWVFIFGWLIWGQTLSVPSLIGVLGILLSVLLI